MSNDPQDRPIGIFDSGIGGLTVAGAIRNLLPNEKLVYFGDTEHLPYGEKSAETIRQYSRQIARFLTAQDCKLIVIACNTASAVAYADVVDEVGDAIPVVNVVDPVANYVGNHFQDQTVGVIATRTTVNSGIYRDRILERNPSLKVASLATPLLVTMIEEGFFNNNISQTIIDSYLSHPVLQGIDALILGCTHFPLIKTEVQKFYSNRIEILDSAGIVARAVEKLLAERNLKRTGTGTGQRFYISEYTDSFAESARTFFGRELELSQFRLWK